MLGFVVPLKALLAIDGFVPRLLVASALTFAPVMLANILFGLVFKGASVPEVLFGWNVLGAALGGMAEYLSMLVGYNALGWVVTVVYAVAFALLVRALRTSRNAVEPVQA